MLSIHSGVNWLFLPFFDFILPSSLSHPKPACPYQSRSDSLKIIFLPFLYCAVSLTQARTTNTKTHKPPDGRQIQNCNEATMRKRKKTHTLGTLSKKSIVPNEYWLLYTSSIAPLLFPFSSVVAAISRTHGVTRRPDNCVVCCAKSGQAFSTCIISRDRRRNVRTCKRSTRLSMNIALISFLLDGHLTHIIWHILPGECWTLPNPHPNALFSQFNLVFFFQHLPAFGFETAFFFIAFDL